MIPKKKRLKVLVISYDFSPYYGSECAIGWNICTKLAKFHDITLLCRTDHRKDIIKYFNFNKPIIGLKIIFCDQPIWSIICLKINSFFFNFMDGIGFRPLYLCGMYAWHKAAFNQLKDKINGNYDIIHQLLPMGFWNTGFFWKLDVPFVWGPIGGIIKPNIKFARFLGFSQFLFEISRSFYSWIFLHINPRFRMAARKASVVFTVTQEEAKVINRIVEIPKSRLLIETATNPSLGSHYRIYNSQRPLRLCWSGLHVQRKALPILFYALSDKLFKNRVIVDVLGEGIQTKNWKKIAESFDLNVNWLGKLPHDKAISSMKRADVFVHTSIREGTSNVILEALSCGLPVICHDAFGMATAITPECGIKIPFDSPEISITGFRNSIISLMNSKNLIQKLSRGAIARSRELTWDKKAKIIGDVYYEVLMQVS